MSPPAWGWPEVICVIFPIVQDVPTRVGMARKNKLRMSLVCGCPHPRGDGPRFLGRPAVPLWMSPPAWGWPGSPAERLFKRVDVPTRVGMARAFVIQSAEPHRCPHPRGDGPLPLAMCFSQISMSPPAWGWPGTRQINARLDIDVPTRVGMARDDAPGAGGGDGCPHPRGDGPSF